MDYQVKNAEDLLKSSNYFLSHFDEFKHLPLEDISCIMVPITRSTYELTAESVKVVAEFPMAEIDFVNKKSSGEMKKYTRKKNSSNDWKHEILSKIESLEKELDEMKTSYECQDKNLNGKEDCENPSLRVNLVNSQSSSPIKSKSHELVKTAKTTGNIDRGSKRSGSEIAEAKKIMDRGFRTARELNEKWELWKRKQKARKDVSLQVSLLPEADPAQIDEEKICQLAEKLTNLLLEQPIKVKRRTTERRNIENSVVISSKSVGTKKPPCGRLAIQRLPDNCIKDALSAQALPSIVIPPTTVESASVNNTKLFCLNHKSENIGNIAKTKLLSNKETPKIIETKKDQADVGLQVDLTESNTSSSERSIGNKLESLKIINKSLIDDFNQTQTLNDLLKKVEESSKICKTYQSSKSSVVSNRSEYKKYIESIDSSDSLSSEISLVVKLNSLEVKNKNDIDLSNLHMFRDLIKKVKEFDKGNQKDDSLKSQLVLERRKSVQSAASKSSNEMSSRNQVDDYKSDFEVESLEKDNRSLTSSLSKISSIDSIESQMKLNKSPSKRSKTPSLNVAESKVYPSVSNTVSTDESILEAQMKRLGISPERTTMPRKPSEGKVNKNIYKEQKLKRISTKSKNHTRRNTLYVKSDGGFIPVDALDTPNVQIIVPEIVVKLPDTINPPIANIQERSPSSSRNSASARRFKKDQLIQTDDTVGDLSDSNSVVNKLNKHFERTQLLLDRIGSDLEEPCHSNILSYLHRRHNTIGNHDVDKKVLDKSPGEINRTEYKLTRHRTVFPFREELNLIGNNSESIGEVSNRYR